MKHTTLAGTQELMRNPKTGVILATGGPGLVRAAYSSGKPAYGVGPGNVPAFIERTADVAKAVADIFAGKTFDYGTICSSEQAIVAEEPLREVALEQCRAQGAYFLSAEEAQKLGALVFLPGNHVPNTKIVGRAAEVIAGLAGFAVPAGTRVLIARLEPAQVGREFPLSAEKLSPILAFYSVANLAAGTELCDRLLRFGGMGHTCAIHSQNEAAIRQFGESVPAFRVCVNTTAVHGSIGYSTNVFPAMTLGCGAPGGNITSDNIGPQHLMNIKRVAWGTRAVEHSSVPASQRLAGAGRAAAAHSAAVLGASSDALPAGETKASRNAIDRSQVAKAVERVLAERGLARGGVAGAASQDLPPASEIAAAIADRVFQSEAGRPTQSAASCTTPAVQPAKSDAAPPPVKIASFVSEEDVRTAMKRSEKILIGPKTIVTPSARDLGLAHNILVDAGGSAKA
jgi:hypothetical protein